jgi:hypothetical protein
MHFWKILSLQMLNLYHGAMLYQFIVHPQTGVWYLAVTSSPLFDNDLVLMQ